jgi:superfamily II DNA helicase RecQ
MQIKIITIPVLGGEAMNEELNGLLRSKKILQVERHLSESSQGLLWCFCVTYLEGGEAPAAGRNEPVDYREILDEESFQRFALLRNVRKKIAAEDGLKVFQVLTNREMAELSKLEELTAEAMKKVPGIGDKKLERFGERLIKYAADEKG